LVMFPVFRINTSRVATRRFPICFEHPQGGIEDNLYFISVTSGMPLIIASASLGRDSATGQLGAVRVIRISTTADDVTLMS
jgi:formate hydrogenlyase subunit 4